MLSALFPRQTSILYDRFNSQEALEAAKANVEKHYAVVGVMEMWDETLEVLENTLPFFFSGTGMLLIIHILYYHTFEGAKELYENSKKEVKKMGQNFHKGFVSEEIKNLVRQNFSREIEFYEFCKERLKLQLENIQGQRTL